MKLFRHPLILFLFTFVLLAGAAHAAEITTDWHSETWGGAGDFRDISGNVVTGATMSGTGGGAMSYYIPFMPGSASIQLDYSGLSTGLLTGTEGGAGLSLMFGWSAHGPHGLDTPEGDDVYTIGISRGMGYIGDTLMSGYVVEYYNDNDDNHGMLGDPVASADTSGTLRVEKQGSIFRFFYGPDADSLTELAMFDSGTDEFYPDGLGGYLLVGIEMNNEIFSASGGQPAFSVDFDDFQATATPIPGAVWLLGTGLLGLVGLRRKFMV